MPLTRSIGSAATPSAAAIPATRARTSTPTSTASRKPISATPPPLASKNSVPAIRTLPIFSPRFPLRPRLRSIDEPIPDAAKDRWVRAQALRIIAFDASAELELKSAFFATGSPRLLLEAAQCAFDQGHFATGMSYGRLIVPNFDSRKISDVPANVWKTLFPLPYEASLRREASRNEFDPMLAAGLIRQESTFQADIVSHANAIGLMQVLPKTGKLLAKQLKVRYTKAKLFDPEYNLELGMLYIAGLLKRPAHPNTRSRF